MAACTCGMSYSQFSKFSEAHYQFYTRNFAGGSKSCTLERARFNLASYPDNCKFFLVPSVPGLQNASQFYNRFSPVNTILRHRRFKKIQKSVAITKAFIQNLYDCDETTTKREPDAALNCKGYNSKQLHGSSNAPSFRKNVSVANANDSEVHFDLEEQLISYRTLGEIEVSENFSESIADNSHLLFELNRPQNLCYKNQQLDDTALGSFRSEEWLRYADNRLSCQTQVLKENLGCSTHEKHMESPDEPIQRNTFSISESQSEICAEIDSCVDLKEDAHLETGSKQSNCLVHRPGSRRVVELMTAWDSLAGRLSPDFLQSKDSQLLIAALKLAIIALKETSFSNGQRLPFARALAVAYLLAELQMDVEVIAAGLLREVVETGMISMAAVQSHLGSGVMHLLHDCMRMKKMPSRVHSLDEESASLLRKYSLAFYDMRAVIVEVTARLDAMRHVHTVPRYQQQILALEAMQIYAPLAHALGIAKISLELEDISFRVLFPDSYAFVENWLRTNWKDGDYEISRCKQLLLSALKDDTELGELVDSVEVLGRVKSRFSTMKKLLKDGRSIEEVHDILGLRVILLPRSGGEAFNKREKGIEACYRALEIVTNLWEEVPGRMKDYIANPKDNGYESLHLSVYLSNHEGRSIPVELQIRTEAMDAFAVEGIASHAFYKGGLTDPHQVRQLKEIMVAAANVAASRFQVLLSDGNSTNLQLEKHDYLFKLFDKDDDGFISMEEFQTVIGELGAERDDAKELMQLVDSNTDGCVSAKEFEDFRFQLRSSEDSSALCIQSGN